MKVYAPPAEIGEPPNLVWTEDRRVDWPATQEAEATYLERMRSWCKANSKHRLAGKEIYIPWADGAARYMVLNGTKLIHIPLGDGWNVPDYMTRGLRVADLERMAV